ncbi:hypothetical protein Goarm_017244 [Gossypium armourianum]|uniref:DUF4283 domain-containing protein n=1 Tax=Gossypium armourianum TaxID=34283 RepID=A0A7J9JG48_9ROSI|nr:hypothetical protein [Gossypium armourianum]
MDLEKYYYLVHFDDEKDYNKVLTRGPWVIFGLPEGYYLDFLLKAISQAIDPVLKIDEHTDSAKKDRFARMAICVDLRKPLLSKVKINVEEESYGPWMIVERRHRWNGQSIGDKVTSNQGKNIGRSHFNVLDEIQGKIGTEEIAYNKEIQIGKLINVKNLTGPVKSQKDKGAKNSNFPKKNNSKAKGKGIHVASGLKMSFNILKPVNGTNGSSSSSGHLVFYDGSKMGKNTVIDGDEPFSFQPIQVRGPLDSIKHKAVKIMDKKTSVSISGKENGSFRFGETSQSGENSSQRPMGMEEFQPIRPPDKEVRSSDQATMEVATVLEEIVTTIEQHSLTVNVRVDDNDFVEVIDAKSSRNDENMC